jgi:hypothetical protein
LSPPHLYHSSRALHSFNQQSIPNHFPNPSYFTTIPQPNQPLNYPSRKILHSLTHSIPLIQSNLQISITPWPLPATLPTPKQLTTQPNPNLHNQTYSKSQQLTNQFLNQNLQTENPNQTTQKPNQQTRASANYQLITKPYPNSFTTAFNYTRP